MKTLVRHLVVIVAAGSAVLFFGWLRGEWDPMHRWNRAFGDTAFILIGLTMSLGPIVVLLPRASPLLPWRREFGIYSGVAATVHTLIVFVGWFGLDLWRMSGFAFHPTLQRNVLVEHGLGLGNWIGAFALIPAIGLVLISSDRAFSFFGPRTWKWLQSAASAIWILVVLHAGYFLVMHFQHFHRPDPPPNPVTWFVVGLTLSVQVLRWCATYVVWRRGLKGRGKGPTVALGAREADTA
jgi:sulfoxide reductase heme-binding subunit YedZ